jgi:hypothetical protein
MMPVDEMRAILKSLLERTGAKEIPWQRESLDKLGGTPSWALMTSILRPTSATVVAFVTVLPQSIIRIAKVAAGPDNEFIQFSFHLSDESILGSWMISKETDDWATADQLFTLIRDQIGAAWNVVISDVLGIRQNVASATAASPLEWRDFFRTVSGEWELTWFSPRGALGGHEDARIDEEGNYYTAKRGESPYMQLRDVFYDPVKRQVTFAKVSKTGLMEGSVRQREVLEISPDGSQMSGYAQHDGHRLLYKRRSPAA